MRKNVLKKNDTGELVRWIQIILKDLGYKVNVDGVYGNESIKAVKDFQEKNTLTVDGVVGPHTFFVLLKKSGYSYEEASVNSIDLVSDTDYLIWVDTVKNLFHVFKGSNRNWKLIHTFLATTGSRYMPTIKGVYKTKVKGKKFGGYKGYMAKWYTQIKGNYLIHSILYKPDGKTIYDDRLGLNISDGCIRLSLENAKYVYDKIPTGTTIVIT